METETKDISKIIIDSVHNICVYLECVYYRMIYMCRKEDLGTTK